MKNNGAFEHVALLKNNASIKSTDIYNQKIIYI